MSNSISKTYIFTELDEATYFMDSCYQHNVEELSGVEFTKIVITFEGKENEE